MIFTRLLAKNLGTEIRVKSGIVLIESFLMRNIFQYHLFRVVETQLCLKKTYPPPLPFGTIKIAAEKLGMYSTFK